MEIAWLCEMEKPRLGTDHDLNISDLAIQSHKKELFTIGGAQHNYMGFRNTVVPLDLL